MQNPADPVKPTDSILCAGLSNPPEQASADALTRADRKKSIVLLLASVDTYIAAAVYGSTACLPFTQLRFHGALSSSSLLEPHLVLLSLFSSVATTAALPRRFLYTKCHLMETLGRSAVSS